MDRIVYGLLDEIISILKSYVLVDCYWWITTSCTVLHTDINTYYPMLFIGETPARPISALLRYLVS